MRRGNGSGFRGLLSSNLLGRLGQIGVIRAIGSEPELAVFHDQSGKRDQQEDQREYQAARLLVVLGLLNLSLANGGSVNLRCAVARSWSQF